METTEPTVTVTIPSEPEPQAENPPNPVEVESLVQAVEAKAAAEQTTDEVQALRAEMNQKHEELKAMMAGLAVQQAASTAVIAETVAEAQEDSQNELEADSTVVDVPSVEAQDDTEKDAPETESENKPEKQMHPVMRLLLGK